VKEDLFAVAIISPDSLTRSIAHRICLSARTG
jgi:hypothetical protein